MFSVGSYNLFYNLTINFSKKYMESNVSSNVTKSHLMSLHDFKRIPFLIVHLTTNLLDFIFPKFHWYKYWLFFALSL